MPVTESATEPGARLASYVDRHRQGRETLPTHKCRLPRRWIWGHVWHHFDPNYCQRNTVSPLGRPVHGALRRRMRDLWSFCAALAELDLPARLPAMRDCLGMIELPDAGRLAHGTWGQRRPEGSLSGRYCAPDLRTSGRGRRDRIATRVKQHPHCRHCASTPCSVGTPPRAVDPVLPRLSNAPTETACTGAPLGRPTRNEAPVGCYLCG
jgi:hypothetical protein